MNSDLHSGDQCWAGKSAKTGGTGGPALSAGQNGFSRHERKLLTAKINMESTTNQPTHDEIARVAYQIWEHRGRPQGFDVKFWLEAERQILSGKPSRVQVTSSGRSSDVPVVPAQPSQSPFKSASGTPESIKQATTKAEGEAKQRTPRTGIPPCHPAKPTARTVAARP